MLCQYLVLLHSPNTCSSSSSCSDAMRMRVLAAFAVPRSLQDLSLNKTLLSLLQKATRSAVHESGATPSLTTSRHFPPLPQDSADILVPPCRQIPAQCGFLRGHLLMICAAKPRYTAAAAREHRRVLAPRLITPGSKCRVPVANDTRGAL